MRQDAAPLARMRGFARPIALRDGGVVLPEGPGLGVEVDEATVARFRVN